MLREDWQVSEWARGFDAREVVLAAALALLLVLVAYPASLVLLKALPWSNYLDLAADPLAKRALLNTLYVGGAVTLLATLLGVATAFLLTRTDLPLKGVLRALIFLAFITPAYIGAVAWIQLLGRSGYVTTLLVDAFDLSAPPIRLYSLEGLIAIMAIHLYPLVFLAASNALSITDPSLEEAAASSGATKLKVLTTITLPLILPSILSGAALVFIQAIACFGVAAVIALPTGHYVLTTRIYTALGHYDVRMACALSVVLVLLAGASIAVHNALLRAVATAESRKPGLIKLGRWRLPIAAVLLLFLIITTVLPLATIVLTSFLKAWGLRPALGNLTLGNYAKMASEGLTARAMRNSLAFAAGGATVAALIGLVVSYISVSGRRLICWRRCRWPYPARCWRRR